LKETDIKVVTGKLVNVTVRK